MSAPFNITPTTRTITDFNLTLSMEAAQACIDQPSVYGELIAEQLMAAGVRPSGNHANGNGHKRSARKATKRAAAPKATKASHICLFCSRTFKHAKRLETHMMTLHPTSMTATHAPATAPAAVSASTSTTS